MAETPPTSKAEATSTQERQRITQQFLQAVALSEGRSRFDRLLVPVLLGISMTYAGWQGLQGAWLKAGAFVVLALALAVVASSDAVQQRLLGRLFNRRHAVYVVLIWIYTWAGLTLLQTIGGAPTAGKDSVSFYQQLLGLIAVGVMLVRSLYALTRAGYTRIVIHKLPMWEQILIAINEAIAAALLASLAGDVIARALQPRVFTIDINPLYTLGLVSGAALYYSAMQAMWWQRTNDWLSRPGVWVNLFRVLMPLVIAVTLMIIARRFVALSDPRSAALSGDESGLAVLALSPLILLIEVLVLYLVYASGRGLRQRFLPDILLDHLPTPIGRRLRTISDMDMLLILGALSTLIPAYLFLLGDQLGIVSALSQQILSGGRALIETSQQALAVLFAVPFYVLCIVLLALYALVIVRDTITADEREELMRALPVGLLIIVIITLYLCAVPFTRVLIERRLPRLPQDLGYILAFNVVIPLLLLYGHYFILVRFPYSRGQQRWRETHALRLSIQLDRLDARINQVNRELEVIDRQFQTGRRASETDTGMQMDALYRYVQLNGMRDDLNMRRLQLVAERQQLAEISEAPLSVTVARLPIRVVSLAIPLLIALQFYQWAFVDNGLREITNNPNITVLDFFRAILEQFQF
jgi:hypothetical protein